MILKKNLLKLGLLGTLIFLSLFFYFYRTTGKFRQSIIAAFVAINFYFSGLTPAHSAGEADAFTPQNQQHHSRPQKREGLPKFPQTNERVENIKPFLPSMESISDSKSECNYAEQKKEIRYRIKEDPGLVRAAKEACENADVQKDVNHLEEQLAKGNENPGIGRKPICKGVIEHRGKNGGRLYVRESDDVIEILAKSGKKKSNK